MMHFTAPLGGRVSTPAWGKPVQFRGDAPPPTPPADKKDSVDIKAKPAAQKPAESTLSGKSVLKMMAAVMAGGGALGGYAHLDNQIKNAQQQNTSLQSLLNSQSKNLQSLDGKVTLSDLAEVVSKVAPSNVMVKGKYGLGSGTWLKDQQGNLYILTNHHVAEDNSIRGKDSPPTFEIRLHNGSDLKEAQTVEAQVIKLANGQLAWSEDHDLALLGVSTPNFRLPDHIKPIEFRDMEAEPLQAGEFVVVVGTPRGLTDNVTHGIISHVERHLGKFEPANTFVGVDAPINGGNSGGSCYDLKGRYIGPPTAGITNSDGLGFVIRTDIVKDMLAEWGVEL
jgi:S1-C subfamily serine protease